MHYASGALIRGKYRVVRLLGDGGMGSVYEAEHIVLQTHVALKFLHQELQQREGLSERFIREARVSASIHSHHVAATTDVDVAEDGSPFLVMELLSGESLQSFLDREKRVSLARTLDYAAQISTGLGAAHALGIVHRDLKPDNVFITRTAAGAPILKLIDFGIAKLKSSEQYKRGLTRSGVLMGTPEYMAPEQAFSAADVDARADVYSFGVILFEMLAGERPVDGANANEIVTNLAVGHVKSLTELVPDVPAPLAALVHASISADPAQRPRDAIELGERLARVSKDLDLPEVTDPELPAVSSAAPITADDPALSATAPAPSPFGGASTAVPAGGKGQTEDAPALSVAESRTGVERQPLVGAIEPPLPRRRRKSSALLIGLGVSALLLVGAIVALYFINPGSDTPPPFPVFDGGTSTPSETPTSAPDLYDPTHEVDPRVVPPSHALPPRPPTVHVPGAPDASLGSDAGWPFPPFTLPSTLPALPSTLPPLPSTFPTTLPPWPGLSPAPAKSAAPN